MVIQEFYCLPRSNEPLCRLWSQERYSLSPLFLSLCVFFFVDDPQLEKKSLLLTPWHVMAVSCKISLSLTNASIHAHAKS
uniref:Uncharacterized protein n=1 Tax=Anguilla anguilla TaxID=7936 RepID=A0A0E9X8Q8_ANGAN